ncbi:TAF6-like RNA polymerase II p300/CBP-associated factor-associated factor 65 kDa subunit 6L [Mytilus trossulus]|uniref:TAF6-like RNA polymerase II p300/CBP-associated factor-associated factor 65 kDa subunit 6L n=1 Tax=Mytilus trossulus TaxID=6551 RepID=UPI003004BAF3
MADKEERKVVDEKRFAIFSKDTIRLIADSVGITEITDQAATLLGEDASYRLREATQNSSQYMKHAKRKKLMTDDFNKALRKSDVQPVYGHRPVDPEQVWTYQQTKDGQIMFLDEADINLEDIALDNNIPSNPGTVSIKAHWLAVEGSSKSQTSQGVSSGKPVEKKLSAEMQTYFDRITNSILSKDEELMKLAFTDLRTNAQIIPLLPYFVSFISNGVKTVSHDLKQLTKLLHTVRALLNNTSLYLEPQPYLNLLVQSLMYCLLEPLTASIDLKNDHWVLRDYVARLLAQILFSWSTPINHLMYNTVKTLKEVLYDNNKPLCSHYGAVIGIMMLDQKHIQEILIPHLPVYMPYLNSIIDDTSRANAVTKSDAHKVYGAVLYCVEYLLKSQIKEFEDEISKEKESSALATASDPEENKSEQKVNSQTLPNPFGTSVTKFYSEMYDYFGDSLTLQLPNLAETIDFKKSVFKPSKKDELISLADPEAAKTGEELLDEFMEQVRVQEEIRKAQLEREKLEKIRIAREKQEQEERNRMLREKEEKRRQERIRADLERELILKRKEEEERLRMLKLQEEQRLIKLKEQEEKRKVMKEQEDKKLRTMKEEEKRRVIKEHEEKKLRTMKEEEKRKVQEEQRLKLMKEQEEQRLRLIKEQEQKAQRKDLTVLNSSNSEDEDTVPSFLDSPSDQSFVKSEPTQGIKLKITRGPNKNLHVKTVETMSPPQRNSPNPKHANSPLYKHSPKSSSPLYKSSPKSHKSELSPHYKHSPKHSHSSKSKDSKESKDSKHSKKKKQVAKSAAKVYDEFEFESDPEDFKPLPFKKSHYYSSEGESSDGAGNRKPLTLKIKMKEAKSPE